MAGSQYLADSRNLAVLLLHLAQQPTTTSARLPAWMADVAAAGKHPWGKSPPDSAVVRSAILTEADRILTAPDRDRAALGFAGWIERVPRRNEGTVAWLADRTHLTPTLYGIVNSAQNPRRRLSHRLDHEPPLVGDARYIPQQIPEEVYEELFADAFQLRHDTGRTFISLCFARGLPDVATWNEAARVLGLPDNLGERTPALATAGMLVNVDDLLQRLHSATGRMPSVDYRRRQHEVSSLAGADQWFMDWIRHHRPGTPPASRRYAITWLWEHHAHGHLNASPTEMTTPKARASYRQFAARLNSEQCQSLARAVEGRKLIPPSGFGDRPLYTVASAGESHGVTFRLLPHSR